MALHDLIRAIEAYVPCNAQEEWDKSRMLPYLSQYPECLYSTDLAAHITASAWIVNPQRTHTLLLHHPVFDAWEHICGHADGETDLAAVALRKAAAETGAAPRLVRKDIFSLETLHSQALRPANSLSRGKQYIAMHLHFNCTYLLELDPASPLASLSTEGAVPRWLPLQQAKKLSCELQMQGNLYRKLTDKCKEA